MSQEALAEHVEVSSDLISMLERGRVGASFRTLQRLADALDVRVYELFEFEDE